MTAPARSAPIRPLPAGVAADGVPARFAAALAAAREEVRLVVSADPLGLRLARGARGPVAAAARRGVRTRVLVQHTALAAPAGAALADAVHGAGADLRVTPLVPAWVLRVDTGFGFVALRCPGSSPGSRRPGVHVLQDPVTLRLLDALFEHEWSIAVQPEAADGAAAEPEPLDLAVLDALASGAKDEVAARSLGLSVRSLRRRVAELMTRLDAGSRFQAGVRAAERGWVTARAER